jgi:short-subunit dehydrogenase
VATAILEAIEKRKAELVLTQQGKLSVLLSKFLPRTLEKLVLKHFLKEEKTLNPTN